MASPSMRELLSDLDWSTGRQIPHSIATGSAPFERVLRVCTHGAWREAVKLDLDGGLAPRDCL